MKIDRSPDSNFSLRYYKILMIIQVKSSSNICTNHTVTVMVIMIWKLKHFKLIFGLTLL